MATKVNNDTPTSKSKRFFQRSMENYTSGYDFNDDQTRRANTLIGFCWTGFVCCSAYVCFYLAIGYLIGAFYILCAALACIIVPFILRSTGNLPLVGGIATSLIIVLFLVLSTLEGGLYGHAIGWLAAMPLCAFLLNGGGKQGYFYAICMALSVLYIAIQPGLGIESVIHYPEHMHATITAVGFIGLALFMVVIGALYENMRSKAVTNAEDALTQLTLANKDLAQLIEEKDKFLEIAAHDLKNPLQGIIGYTELLQKNPAMDQNTQQECPQIIESADRMLSIINNLLDVNAMETGRYPIRPEIVNLEPLLKSCLKSYAHPAKLKRIQWDVETTTTKAWVDPSAWGQVADNLISNAVKFVRPDGLIRVRLNYQEGLASLIVANQCSGFSEDDFNQLFRRFSKLSTRPTAGESSTGLGLSITQKLIHEMQGEINCENEANFGLIFSTRFLIKPPEQS